MDKIEYRIEKSNRKTAWTYCIYEDKEKGKLHMAIFRESLKNLNKILSHDYVCF